MHGVCTPAAHFLSFENAIVMTNEVKFSWNQEPVFTRLFSIIGLISHNTNARCLFFLFTFWFHVDGIYILVMANLL